MNGQGFDLKVKEVDQVSKGQDLIMLDQALIESKGYSTVVPIIITNTHAYATIEKTDAERVVRGDFLLKTL